MKQLVFASIIFVLALSLGQGSLIAFAQSVDVDDLNTEIKDKESEIDSINRKIDEYRKRVSELTNKTASLLNDIELIENQIALAELDIQSTQAEIEAQQLEVEILEERVREETQTIEDQKDMLEEMLFQLNKSGKIGFVEVVFGAENFNELFSELEHLESVNADLNNSLNATKVAKANLEEHKSKQEDRLDRLVVLEEELKVQVHGLEENVGAKNILVEETQSSESQYRVLMSELRQEQQFITSQIAQLQVEIEQRIRENGGEGSGDPGSFQRPLDSYIVTATFHDPTYPFRHLFEHSGIDLAAPTGTPVKSTAPGVVAWTKTGRSYGNYAMVIHQGGYASLYAHMSRFAAVPDQFVGKGQVIGYVGSTGFSTGPHLHFEVRLNGIPVNPGAYMNF